MKKIICSAIWFADGKSYENQPSNIPSGLVIGGVRHVDCLYIWSLVSGVHGILDNYIYGFLTSDYQFIPSKEALEYALVTGQIDKVPSFHLGKLHSEDLY